MNETSSIELYPECFKNSGCLYHEIQPEKVQEIPLEVIGIESIFELVCVPFSEDAFEGLNRLIENTLMQIECLTSHFDTCCCRWRLYYGTPSIEDTMTIEQRKVYYNKNRVMQDLLMKIHKQNKNTNITDTPLSTKMFAVPENSEESLEEFTRVLSRREWCISEIFIMRKISENNQVMLSCYFNRLCGSRTTAMYIFRELRNNISLEKLPTRNELIISSRIAFLQFVEGITPIEKREEHVYKYLCNDLLVREMCSLIPYRKYI